MDEHNSGYCYDWAAATCKGYDAFRRFAPRPSQLREGGKARSLFSQTFLNKKCQTSSYECDQILYAMPKLGSLFDHNDLGVEHEARRSAGIQGAIARLFD